MRHGKTLKISNIKQVRLLQGIQYNENRITRKNCDRESQRGMKNKGRNAPGHDKIAVELIKALAEKEFKLYKARRINKKGRGRP